MPGGVCDTDRGSAVILDEFRAGKIGRITLQRPPARKAEAPKEEKKNDDAQQERSAE